MGSKQSFSTSSRERINEIIASVAEIEFALADAINAQTRLLRRENLTPEQLKELSDNLGRTIALSIQKEMMLQFIIQEAVDALDTVNNPDPKK